MTNFAEYCKHIKHPNVRKRYKELTMEILRSDIKQLKSIIAINIKKLNNRKKEYINISKVRT